MKPIKNIYGWFHSIKDDGITIPKGNEYHIILRDFVCRFQLKVSESIPVNPLLFMTNNGIYALGFFAINSQFDCHQKPPQFPPSQ